MDGQSLGRAAGCRGEAPEAVDSRARALCRSSWGTSHWPKQASSSSLWLMRIWGAPQPGDTCITSTATCTNQHRCSVTQPHVCVQTQICLYTWMEVMLRLTCISARGVSGPTYLQSRSCRQVTAATSSQCKEAPSDVFAVSAR